MEQEDQNPQSPEKLPAPLAPLVSTAGNQPDTKDANSGRLSSEPLEGNDSDSDCEPVLELVFSKRLQKHVLRPVRVPQSKAASILENKAIEVVSRAQVHLLSAKNEENEENEENYLGPETLTKQAPGSRQEKTPLSQLL
eukprot:CAMPEP_0177665510 /NCGR_PEP_ID=MMETSP0447-20121125/21090_1 /TAXON_ID=0 /ORGANISM="Stygamoeba regulata, Strain BSH-02190019" /LENGTH=138 /DNA_ID=CAMNT_0019171603 /DNA_START=326 /DNA_END=739 /DNA_ORIENTATION=+